MPSGKTHAFATGLTGASVLFLPFQSLETALLLSFGCFLGLFIYPDLDVDRGNYGFYLFQAVFGKKLRKLWEVYWWPYAKLMYHRSALSHFPVLSTIVRLAYFGTPIFFVWWLFGVEWSNELQYVLFGLIAVDTLHFVMDIISTALRRAF